MHRGIRQLKKHYAPVLLGLFVIFVVAVYAAAGEKFARIAVADNLDLFQAQYQMLRNTGAFFSQDAQAPFLHGITRDVLPGEFSLASFLYLIFPPFPAYIANYLVKVVLAAVSFYLLARELKMTEDHGNLAVLGGFAYGILNLFPAYGISFASIPLLIFLLLRLDRAQGSRQAALWVLSIFFYPVLSYFSYFGIFLLGYLCLAWLFTSIARRKPNHRLFFAILALASGSVLCEYRLFRTMLLGSEETIRSTMKIASLSGGEVLGFIRDALATGATMHTQDVHTCLVLPVCGIYFLVLNIGYLRRGEGKKIFQDPYNLTALLIVFNAVIYGLYYYEPFRSLIETAVPPLKGFQFNRTVFFNPFLWYWALFLAAYRLYGYHVRGRAAAEKAQQEAAGASRKQKGRQLSWNHLGAVTLEAAAILVILASGTPDNDLYHTVHAMASYRLKGVQESSLSYGEFYSEDLFRKAMDSIGYEGEWSAAYGFHPAVLEYSGIRTLDGYLGFYSEQYKEQFRRIIAPALERQPATRQYFDDWGARCYLYSGTEGTNVEAVRDYAHTEEPLYIDVEAFRQLGGKYLFSRPAITNAGESGLTLVGTFTDENSAYVLHVYSAE